MRSSCARRATRSRWTPVGTVTRLIPVAPVRSARAGASSASGAGRASLTRNRKEQTLITTIDQVALEAFLDAAEDRGSVLEAELEALAVEHDLDEEHARELRAALEARGVTVQEDEAEADTPAPAESAEPTVSIDYETGSARDSLQLFLNSIARHPLL